MAAKKRKKTRARRVMRSVLKRKAQSRVDRIMQAKLNHPANVAYKKMIARLPHPDDM